MPRNRTVLVTHGREWIHAAARTSLDRTWRRTGPGCRLLGGAAVRRSGGQEVRTDSWRNQDLRSLEPLPLQGSAYLVDHSRPSVHTCDPVHHLADRED